MEFFPRINVSTSFLNADTHRTFNDKADNEVFFSHSPNKDDSFLSVLKHALLALFDFRAGNATRLYDAIVECSLAEFDKLSDSGLDLDSIELDLTIETAISGVERKFNIKQTFSDDVPSITCGFEGSGETFTKQIGLKEFYGELQHSVSINRNKFISDMKKELNGEFENSPEKKLRPTKGFVNLGNTCYANSSLKTLLISIGAIPLYRHLERLLESNAKRVEFLKEYVLICDNGLGNAARKVELEAELNTALTRAKAIEGDEKRKNDPVGLEKEVIKRYKREIETLPTYNRVIDAFLPVIIDSCLGNEPLKHQLKSFFDEMQKTDVCNTVDMEGNSKIFKLIGTQQDSQEFMSKLATIFQLEKMQSRKITIIENKEDQNDLNRKDKHGFKNIANEWKLESNVYQDMGLQAMFDEFLTKEQVQLKWDDDTEFTPTIKSTSYALDTRLGKQIFHHINAMSFDSGASKLKLTKLDVDSPIEFTCLDINDDLEENKLYRITALADKIIYHEGSANGGHYYMYSRRDDGQWDVHDDSHVYVANGISKNGQAKFINYKITARQEIIQPEPIGVGEEI